MECRGATSALSRVAGRGLHRPNYLSRLAPAVPAAEDGRGRRHEDERGTDEANGRDDARHQPRPVHGVAQEEPVDAGHGHSELRVDVLGVRPHGVEGDRELAIPGRQPSDQAVEAAIDGATRLLRLPTFRARYGEIADAAGREQLAVLDMLELRGLPGPAASGP